jgi:hypothetical protein
MRWLCLRRIRREKQNGATIVTAAPFIHSERFSMLKLDRFRA